MNALEVFAHPEAYMGPDTRIITEATILALEFSDITFVHCHREANLVADGLAKHCFSLNASEYWEGDAHDVILP